MNTIKGLCYAVLCMISVTFGTYTNTSRLTNKGTQFILGFMPNVPGYLITLRLSITTQLDKDVSVNITTPLFDSFYQNTLSVRSGQVTELTLNSTLQGTFDVEDKGIFVEADEEVSVYASNTAYTTMDDFLVLPNVVLGNEYYVISAYGKDPSFMVVATNDYTQLTVILGRSSSSVSMMGRAVGPGETISVNMRKFETFYVQKTGSNSKDFTGTYIHGNTSFAVFGGSMCGDVINGGCDHLAEQMLPVDKWGNEFVTLSMPGCAAEDLFKIVAGFDNTTVNISGISAYTLSTSGDFYSFTLPDSSFRRVSSDKPISLFMFSSGGCKTTHNSDPSMLMIPALSQYSSNVTFATNSTDKINFENYVGIVIDKALKNGLRFDGAILPSVNWFFVDGLQSHVYTEFKVSPGIHSISHLNDSVKFLAFAAGIHYSISYSYLLGVDFLTNDEVLIFIYLSC